MKIKKSFIKSLIKESISEVLKENIKDPTREEMLTYLSTQFSDADFYKEDAEVAMYWFANDYHGGQWSNLYSVLSTSPYRPGPLERGPEKDSTVELMYQSLESQFGGNPNNSNEMTEEEQPEPYDPESNQFAPGPRQRPEGWENDKDIWKKEQPITIKSPMELVDQFRSGKRFLTIVYDQQSPVIVMHRDHSDAPKYKNGVTLSIRKIDGASAS